MRENLIVHQDPKSPISEIFRTLRTNIQFMSMKKELKSLLVSSTLPGEGKSWVSSNLAVAFAQAGKKVILVDADMRKGTQYSIFGISPIPGLSNYLSGIGPKSKNASSDLADYIQETEVDNLYVMPAGNIPPNPSELLVSQQMMDLLEKLKQICDLVIIDGTPNGLVTDSLILTGIVDSTIIVTASGYTKKESLKKIVNNIKNIGGSIAGIVLNKVPTNAKKYEESYYYGSTTMPMVKPKNPRSVPNSRTTNKAPRPTSVQSKREDMKKRVRPENPQLNRIQQEERQRTNEIEKAKSLENKMKIENSEDISIERTTDILNQINAYLDEEKKNLSNKG